MLLCHQVKLHTQPRSCRHGSPSSTPWPLLGAHPWEGQISAQRQGYPALFSGHSENEGTLGSLNALQFTCQLIPNSGRLSPAFKTVHLKLLENVVGFDLAFPS